MGRRRTGRGLLVGACLLTFLSAGCTPNDPPPAPPSTNVPSPTPTENAQEREERLAYEAAEKSYREFRAEFYRVLGAGGAKSATPVMRATAAGPYLKNFTEVAEAYREQKSYSRGAEVTGYIRRAGYESVSLVLDVCEDTRNVKDYSRSGKYQGRGEVRVARLEARKVSGAWKIWDGKGEKVTSCE